MLIGCGYFVQRWRAKRSTLSFLVAQFSTLATIVPDRNDDIAVSAAMFADFVHKCGLSKKRLHQQLYPLEFGTSSFLMSDQFLQKM